MSASISFRPKYDFILNDALTLLVVDANSVTRESARVHLSTPMVAVITAANAQDAQRRLDEDRIDIVMVDIDLAVPNLVQPCATPDCLQMIRDIRANPRLRHMPVIAVTRHDDIVSIDGAYEAGAISFATKPVDWRVLQTQLRYVLRAQGLIAA